MKKHILTLLSCLLVVALLCTNVPVALAATPDKRVVDQQTIDRYRSLIYDDNDNIDTYSAGAVWTDKSVMTDSALDINIPMVNEDENFLVALSAIASNKEIIGYSAIPTDTMIILDASMSMSAQSLRDMVNATNDAIAELYQVNNHNRVGIVIYNRNADVLMAIDRYTPNANGDFLSINSTTISIANGVKDSNGDPVSKSIRQGSGTYIQGGIYTALQEFNRLYQNDDTTIESGQIQGGTARMPIFLLMTDGRASYSASNYTAATNSAVDSNLDESDRAAFLTMLTAAYAKQQASAYYNRNALFYTLGYGSVLNYDNAVSALDPENMTATFAGYCDAYNQASVGDTVTLYRGANITKRASGTDLHYVDAFFAARTDLSQAFADIVQEIIIQSRYYATHISGTDPDFDGYLYFEDKLGQYMEVKEIKGIKHGQDYFTGAALASHLNETDLGTMQNPTAFGIAFRDSVKARLNIANNADAFALIENAYAAGQLHYNSNTDYSNYIGWYSDANGNYLGFWNEGVTSAPANATHKNQSYGFYGKINENTVSETDMMFMSIMVRTEIATGDQTVMWRIPASLMPMVTYKVELDGTTIAGSTVKSLSIENESTIAPVRLLYEVGINDKVINPLNVEQLGTVKDQNGNYRFWTNYFDKSAPEHEDHIAAHSEFYPNAHNERYFYTEDTPIYIKNGNDYLPVTDRNHTFNTSAENIYYHIRYSFREGENRAIVHYEPISTVSLGEDMRKYENGQWYIKQGTVYRIIYPTSVVPKALNATASIEFSHKPFITLENGTPKAIVKLGNNGLTTITPATGLKLSKTMAPGVVSDETFTFTVKLTAPNQTLANAYSYILADLDGLSGTAHTADVTNGVMTVTLKPNQTAYFTDIPAGFSFEITEQDSVNYKPSTVTVDGTPANGLTAVGTVVQDHLSDVDFVNRLKDTGVLSITKTVEHPYGNHYVIPDNITFPVTVTLTDANNNPYANKTFPGVGTTNANGEISFTIAHGQTVMLTDIHEDIRYTVTEGTSAGFTLDQNKSSALSGTVTADAIAVAHLVNTYTPRPASPDILFMTVAKNLTGRDWLSSEYFIFELRRESPDAVNQYPLVDSRIVDSGTNNKTIRFHLSDEEYPTIGTYLYVLSEYQPPVTAGVAYDQTERIFAVTVTDKDMDGALEIDDVYNVMGTTVEQNYSIFSVTADPFTNRYSVSQGTVATIPMAKTMDRQNGLDHALDGFVFRLTDVSGNTIDSAPTDAGGNTHISISYAPHNVGQTFTYTLKEVPSQITGMQDDPTEYTVTVKILDNFDGTCRSEVTVTKGNDTVNGAALFTNTYLPAATTATVNIQKAMDTQNGVAYQLDGYTFGLYENDTLVATSTATDGNGKATVSIDYDAFDIGNTFVYTLKEIDPQITGMTYDRTEYTVTVTVKDNNGTVDYDMAITKGNDTVSGDVTFTNLYVPKTIDIPVTVQKTMSQNGLTYKLDGFEFRLKGEGLEETLISDTDGKALYTLTLDKDDIGKTLTYTLTEVNTGIADMTYDTKTVTVSIDVTLENGELVAAVKQEEKAVTEITAEFVNTYAKQEPIPSTGDRNLPLYLTLLITSAGLAISLIYRKKITE